MPGAFEELRAEMILDADGVESGVASAERSLGGLKTAIGAAGAAAAGLAVGGLAKSVSAAADFEQQMVELEKVTNPETAREMGSAIQDMAGQMPLAQSELAGIAEQAGRLGVTGTDNIRNFTQVTGEMATATDLTAEEAADSFARMSTLLNEPIDNVRTLGDATNALSNSMATSSSEITDAATRSSGALTNMGMASEDVLALNAAMNEVSPSARVAGTQLRRMGQEMMNPKKAGALADALGMNVDEFKNIRANDPTQLIQQMAKEMGQGGAAADKLRGTLSTTSRQALAGLSNNLDGMNQALETSSQQFAEGGSLAAEFETAMGTFENQVQIARNVLNNIAITIGNVLLPHLTTLMEYVSGALRRFQDWNEATDGVAATIGLVSTAVGGTIVALQTLLPLVTNGTTLIGALKIAFATLTGPVGLAAAAVGTLAAVFMSDFAGIRTATQNVVSYASSMLRQTLVPAFSLVETVVGDLRSAFATHVSGIESRVAGLVQAVQFAFQGAIGDALGAVQRRLILAQRWWMTHRDAVVQAVGGVVSTAQTLITWFQSRIPAALNTLRSAFDSAMAGLSNFLGPVLTSARGNLSQLEFAVTNAISTIQTEFGTTIAFLQSTAAPAFRSFVTLATTQFNRLQTILQPIISAVRDSLQIFLVGAIDAGIMALQTLAAVVGNVASGVGAIVRGEWTTAWAEFKNAGDLAIKGVQEILRTSIQTFQQIFATMKPVLVQAAKAAFGAVKRQALAALAFGKAEVIPRVKTGLDAAWTWIKTEGVALAKQALSFLSTQALAALNFSQEQIVPPIRNGLGTAWTWVRTEGVALAKTAFSFLATQALTAFAIGREQVVPRVRTGLNQAWTWVRTEGLTLAKNALSFLTAQALTALEFTREQVVPPVRNGLNQAWTWVRTEGVTLAKNALSFLTTQALLAWEFTRDTIVPPVRSGLNQAWTWVRTEGVALGKSAFGQLVTLTMNAVDFWNGAIQPRLLSAFNSAKTWVMGSGLERFKSGFRTLGANWYPMVLDTLGLLLEAFQTIVPRVAGWLQDNGPGIYQSAFYVIGRGIRTAILTMFAIPGIVGQAVVSAINGIRDWFTSGGKERLVNGFRNIISGIVSYLRNDAWSDLKATAKYLFDVVMSAAEGLYQGLIGGSLIPEMFQEIVSYIRGVDIQGAMHEILNAAYLWVKNTAAPQFTGAIEDILSAILSAITSTDVKGAFFDVLDSAYRFVTGIASDFKSAGKGLIDAMVNGIKNNAGRVKDKIEDMVGDARDLLPWSDAKEGPFSDLTGSGAAIPETIAKGVEKNLGTLKDVLGKVPSPGPDSRPTTTATPRPGSTPTPQAQSGESIDKRDLEQAVDNADRTDEMLDRMDSMIDRLEELNMGEVRGKEILRALFVLMDREGYDLGNGG